jgi:tetratricopeptide (TPR) repeat protein
MKSATRFLTACSLLALLAACDSPQEKEAKYIEHGNKLFDKGEFEKARVEYKNAAKLSPTAAEPYYHIGMVDEAEGDLHNAFGSFMMAEQQDPHFHPASLKVAQYFMAAEQYAESHKRVDAVLADDGKDAEAHALNAALMLREKNLGDAEKEAKTALALDPASISATSAMTGIYAAENKRDEAVAAINQGIAHNPNSLALLMLRVLLYEQVQDLPKIDESYQAIFKLKPEADQYRADLAAIYVKAGKLDEAEHVLRQAITEKPDDWELKRQLVGFLGANRGTDQAEAEIKSLMQANPKNDDLYFWLADLYASHDQTDKATALLQQIIDRNQGEAPALNARNLLARIDIREGNRELARKMVNAVLEKQADNKPALYIRANLEFEAGDYQNAVSDLRSILGTEPKNIGALQLLAETLLMQGHLDLAIDTLQKAAEADPANMQARARLAQMVHANGDRKQAMDMISLVTKAAPDYAVGWESAARFAIADKEWLPAEQAVQTLDKIEGQHETAAYLEGQILENTGKKDDAVAKYKEVVAADANAPLAEHALASLMAIYNADNKMTDAVTYLESLNNSGAYVQTLLGKTYEASGKKSEAAAAYDKAIAANPNLPDAYLGRAMLAMDDKKNDSAIELLKKASTAAPADARAPMMLAQLLSAAGQNAEAIAIYEGILARNPTMDAAANNMAEMIADTSGSSDADLEKARQTAERFSGAKNPLLLDTLAWVYYRQGKLDQAQTVIARAMSLAGDHDLPAQVHYHYAMILLKADRKPEAKAELQKAVIPGEPYSGLDEAKKALSGL